MGQSVWCMVRLHKATLARLKAYRESLVKLADGGRLYVHESGKPGGGPPSLDWVICRLIDQIDAHRTRARKARGKNGEASEA